MFDFRQTYTWIQSQTVRVCDWFTARIFRTLMLVGILSFVINVSYALFIRAPIPSVNDEFSYLLAGDTFAHGRLTNPAHPFWEHFESMHIVHQPTYASRYPPGQGLVLAFGQALTDSPIFGVWISVALACAALTWMLFSWLPPRWAFLGGLLALLHPLMLIWGQNYWGGAVAVTGGALLLGALPRLSTDPKPRDAFIMAAGMALLANSRPAEGFALALVCFITLFIHLRSSRVPLSVCWRKIILPALVVLLPVFTAMAYYNFRVTGDPAFMPYMLHEAYYGTTPIFVWQDAPPKPEFRHETMRIFQTEYILNYFTERHSILGWVRSSIEKTYMLVAEFFWNSGFLMAFMFLPLLFTRNRRQSSSVSVILVLLVLFLLALLQEVFLHMHYAAPAMGLVVLISIFSLERLRHLRWRALPIGGMLVVASSLFGIIAFSTTAARLAHSDSTVATWYIPREQIINDLKKEGGKHLIMVRYNPNHTLRPPYVELVYNNADIDGSPVVWAREMDMNQDKVFFEHFSDRRIWLLEADVLPLRLLPYPPIK